MNTPVCSDSTAASPWRSFADHRMSCITARASLSATFASSVRSYPRRTASGPSKDSIHCR